MITTNVNIHDRVRESSSSEENEKIDSKVIGRMAQYRNLAHDEINRRLEKLGREWDMEKTLEVNASSLALTGLILGTFASRKWLVLPFVVGGFLLQHALHGWSAPLTLFRRLGVRTKQEIIEEMYALKAMRGDFDNINSKSDPEEIIEVFRR